MAQKSQPKVDGSIIEHYREYLKSNMMIGFTNSFPVQEELESITINENNNLTFKVSLVRLSYGKKKTDTVLGIVTDRVKIKREGPLGGWGQHGYVDEAKIMEAAVVKMCLEKDLMICNKICSWPFAKVVVQPNYFKS